MNCRGTNDPQLHPMWHSFLGAREDAEVGCAEVGHLIIHAWVTSNQGRAVAS